MDLLFYWSSHFHGQLFSRGGEGGEVVDTSGHFHFHPAQSSLLGLPRFHESTAKDSWTSILPNRVLFTLHTSNAAMLQRYK